MNFKVGPKNNQTQINTSNDEDNKISASSELALSS